MNMKLLLKSVCIALVLTVAFSLVPFEAECVNISEDVFRLHIIANSDSDEDQALKLKIRDAILNQTDNLYKGAGSKAQAMALTEETIPQIEAIARKVVAENGYSYAINAEITNMYFDTRYYDDITMPSGQYDALRITVGSGSGKNWWCVMYPSLCVGAATNYDALKENVTDSQYDIMNSGSKYEFKFKLVEYYELIKSYLTN